jgi:hypothetical protein
MADSPDKRKIPLVTYIVAVVVVGLLIMLVIGIGVI